MHTVYRLKYEDRDLEPIGDYDVFDDLAAALAAFGGVLANPTDDLGAVYLTADDCYDERVIKSAFVYPCRQHDC